MHVLSANHVYCCAHAALITSRPLSQHRARSPSCCYKSHNWIQRDAGSWLLILGCPAKHLQNHYVELLFSSLVLENYTLTSGWRLETDQGLMHLVSVIAHCHHLVWIRSTKFTSYLQQSNIVYSFWLLLPMAASPSKVAVISMRLSLFWLWL